MKGKCKYREYDERYGNYCIINPEESKDCIGYENCEDYEEEET